MEYGCIGEHLKHSFSSEIHALLGSYKYELKEIPADELEAFIKARDFSAVNVTIPYKEKVIPYLSEIDANAKRIGAVNTVVSRGGALYGYNTDFYGMVKLIEHAGVVLAGKKVAILGTGGTSKTAHAVAGALGAEKIIKVSRRSREDAVTYGELYCKHSDTQVIINTTPAGMFPDNDTLSLDIDRLPALSGVIDAVYNPNRTKLVISALKKGIPAEGGLYMLVAQALRASEIFMDTAYPEGTLDELYKKILTKKENIVLVGMPTSGKSTVGKIIADELSLPFYDTDALIEEKLGMPIPQIFERHGEAYFRDTETDVINEVSRHCGCIIATGGGAVLRKENTEALKQNGRIYFIDRPLKHLLPTPDRPLAKSAEEIERRFSERYGIYTSCADIIIDAEGDALSVARKIINNKQNY